MQQHKDERGRGEAHQEYHQAPTTKIISGQFHWYTFLTIYKIIHQQLSILDTVRNLPLKLSI
jgi:hypothetical protein